MSKCIKKSQLCTIYHFLAFLTLISQLTIRTKLDMSWLAWTPIKKTWHIYGGKTAPRHCIKKNTSHTSNKPSYPCPSIHSVPSHMRKRRIPIYTLNMWQARSKGIFFAQARSQNSRTCELLVPHHGLPPARPKPACLKTDYIYVHKISSL